ncbi:extracellular solute-binding protein family 1 [Spirochaeta thermophila DSM 6578]|uniref:Extracellular solute-binding protein family 1 n=1 Tax=Winmispira thermophila (strain ATCC 700085 / DSM 6578 / Z-1203) TaxID=869211 RepID=G0GBZ2_WINT7|nr:sugar ABC transporter substrate-binding protein [Spirochaeta thermophila]AEJ62003.1 extracellular solute-binding protein family 1 [Spirochaeta thermophila DSM 6578]
MKRVLVLFLGAMLLLMVPGCAKKEGTTAKAEGPVTLRWFLRWDQTRVDNVAKPVIEEFQQLYPHITVELENIGSGTEYYAKLQTMVAGGLAPDVFYPATHVAYAYAIKGAIRMLDDFIKRDKIDLSAYNPQILNLYKLNGKVYGLPIDTAALVVFYNKDLFDQAGVPYPKKGWTWDDFLETAKKLTKDFDGDGQPDQFGVDQFRNYWPLLVWSHTGHGLFDDIRKPTTFIAGSDPKVVESIQWIADLMLVHNVMPTDEQRADISDLFAAGKAAMQIVGHWRVNTYLKAGINFDCAPLPIGDSGKSVNRADGSCFVVSSQSKHPEEAWEFVKFLAAPGARGVSMLLGLQIMTPALIEFQKDPRFLTPEQLPGVNKAAFLEGEYLFPMYDPIHPMYAAFDAAWKQELGLVWLGQATAKEAMERLKKQVEDMLKNLEDYE